MVTIRHAALVVIVLAVAVFSGFCGKGPSLAAGERPSSPPTSVADRPSNSGEILHRTTNFLLEAPSSDIARKVGEAAERLRRQLAIQWLGQELPPWPERCHIQIQIGLSKGGYSKFSFDKGKPPSQTMSLSGSVEDILADTLPHEMTHVILANRLRRPFPRWADEGAAMLAEGDATKLSYDLRLRKILATSERAISVRRLFAMEDYPADYVAFYSEGFSVSRFLLESGGRQKFLEFIEQGLRDGWDQAIQTHYHFRDLEELEKAWMIITKPSFQRNYAIELAIKDRQADGSWKILCQSCLDAPEGKPVTFFSGSKVLRPQSTEAYPVGYSVRMRAIASKGARTILEARVEKCEAFELEDGQFESQKEGLVTIDEVNLGNPHKIIFAKDPKGQDKTIVELSLREAKENARPKKVIANAME